MSELQKYAEIGKKWQSIKLVSMLILLAPKKVVKGIFAKCMKICSSVVSNDMGVHLQNVPFCILLQCTPSSADADMQCREQGGSVGGYVNRCQVGFTSQHFVKHKDRFNGALAQGIEFYSVKDNIKQKRMKV